MLHLHACRAMIKRESYKELNYFIWYASTCNLSRSSHVIGWAQKSIFWFRKGITWTLDSWPNRFFFVRVGVCDPTIENQTPYKYKGWRPIDNIKSNLSIHLLFIFSHTFPIYHFFSLFVLDDVHCFNDGEALERSDRLGQLIAVAHPDGVPPGRVGFRVSRDLADVSCVSCSRWGSSGDVTCVSRSPSPIKESHKTRYLTHQDTYSMKK
jgi:hypothetical protein